MSFHDVHFPVAIARGASGGPERRTEIVVTGSGAEQRNTRWYASRRRYNAGYGVRSLADIHDAVAFFEARRGRLHAFRWKDHADWKSCAPDATPDPGDQAIGTGDGATTDFQLVKSYGTGAQAYLRTITKPVAASVRVAVDGVELASPADFSVDGLTGIVTFAGGSVPAPGAAITAGFDFDVAVRFDADVLEVNLAAFGAGQIPDIRLIEVIE